MAKPFVPLYDAFGGLMTKGESTTRPPGTASVCTNMRVGRDGKTLRKMHGGTRWSSSQVNGSDPVLGMTQFTDKQGVIHEIARTPNGYYEHDLSDGSWSVISGSATNQEDDGIPMFSQMHGKLYVVDGYNAYVYDGSTWSTWARLTAPENGLVSGTTQRPSASLTTGGSLTPDSEYEVFFTFADNSEPTQESPPSDIMRIKTGTDTGTSEIAIKISTGYAGRNGANPRVTNQLFHLPTDVAALTTDAFIYAYVSAADTPGAWYRGATAAINSTNNDENEITITAESTTNQFEDFYGPPRYASGVVFHHSRLWTWGSPGFPSRIWFTELETAGTFLGANFIDIGVDETFDPIRAVVPFGSGGSAELLILKLNSVWRLRGATFSTFIAERIMQGPSCLSERSAVAAFDAAVYWAGHEGAYRLAAGQIESLTDMKIRDDWRSDLELVSVA
jgi:hypothetical protein